MIKRLNSRRRNKGFSLLEVMTVVGIVAILAAVATPAYLSQQRKGVRTEAIRALTQIQVEIERCRGIRGGYDCCDNPDGAIARVLTVQAPITDQGNYTIVYNPVVTNAGFPACKRMQAYTLTATPLNDQLNDSCISFMLDNLGSRVALDALAVPKPSCWTD